MSTKLNPSSSGKNKIIFDNLLVLHENFQQYNSILMFFWMFFDDVENIFEFNVNVDVGIYNHV